MPPTAERDGFMSKPSRRSAYAIIPPTIVCVLLSMAGCSTATTTVTPPDAVQRPVETHRHGRVLVDEYAWLREKSNPEVIAYLEAENEWAESATRGLRPLEAQLYEEMLERIQQSDTAAPTPRGGYLYYTRTVDGRPYELHCRRLGSMDAEEEILLDVNEAAGDRDYYSIEAFEPSPDGRRLAWLVDTSGYERCDLYVKDLETGEIIDPESPISIRILRGQRQPDVVLRPTGRSQPRKPDLPAPHRS